MAVKPFFRGRRGPGFSDHRHPTPSIEGPRGGPAGPSNRPYPAMTPASRRPKDPLKVESGRPRPPSPLEVADDETLDRVFKALDNEIRRSLLGAVHDSPRGLRSSHIAARFAIPWPGVSRHLRILTDAGLLRCEVIPNGRIYLVESDIWERRRAGCSAWRRRGSRRPKAR